MTALPTTRITGFVLAAAAVLLSSGCGAVITDNGSATGTRTVSVQRCGQPVQYTTPQRVITYEAGSTDKMFALGLQDKVLGYVMTPTNPDPSTSPYATLYAQKPLLSDQLLNKEVVVENKADMVIAGWNSGFSEKRGITPAILDELGIQSFMHTESCFNYPGYPEKMRPFEALYADFERLGTIFGVEDRAEALTRDLRRRMEAVKESVPSSEPRVPVFLYDSGTDKPYTIGNQVPGDEIIEAAGGRNVFHDLEARYTEVSWESVVAADPEVIIIMEYRDQPAEEKIAALRNNAALAEVSAIKNNRIYVMDYNELISGPRNVDGAEKFAQWLSENR